MIKKLFYKIFLERKISTKILIFTLLFSAFIAFVITVVELYVDYKDGYKYINKQLNLVKSSYLISLNQSVWVYDSKQLKIQLDGILNLPNIKYVVVELTDGTLFQSGEKVTQNFIMKTYQMSYIHNGQEIQLGTLSAQADLNDLYTQIKKKIILVLISQAIKTFLSAFFILFLFQRLLTRHIDKIVAYTKSLTLGAKREPLILDKFTSINHQDELDELLASINSMESQLYENYNSIYLELQKRKVVEKSLTEHKNRLEKLYMTDSLTGLGNRVKLIHDLECTSRSAVVILDIADFKEINDFYGNQIGDMVILECANRLRIYTQSNISEIYRLHSDQFALSFENIINVTQFEKNIKELVANIVQESIFLDGNDIPIAIATGIAINEDDLYINADLALKIAKKEHKSFVTYSKEFKIEKEYEKNLLWTKKLKQALKDNRITAYFQPIYNQKTKKVEKCEALVRMVDIDGSIISPYFFLDVAIKSKLYHKITMIMIDKVIYAACKHDLNFSINFTINDILNQEVTEYFITQISKYNIGGKIILELVESENIENYNIINMFIDKIKSLGCGISIDDFGTGYSNFEYLLRLNADYVKIDGSLIKNIDKDKNMQLVTQNIVNFAKIAKMKTVAEFVFDENVMRIMQDFDVDYLQGYYISEPVSYENIGNFKDLSF